MTLYLFYGGSGAWSRWWLRNPLPYDPSVCATALDEGRKMLCVSILLVGRVEGGLTGGRPGEDPKDFFWSSVHMESYTCTWGNQETEPRSVNL
jgi:hypothetical protein